MSHRTAILQRGSLAYPRTRRCTITVDGVVQGIGFRPSVYRLAVTHGVAGTVRNSRAGVVIEAEGDAASLEAFLAALGNDAPGVVSIAWAQPEGLAGFSIAGSAHDGRARFSPAPDRAMTIAFTGKDGGRVATLADHAFVVPSFSIHRIQETHVALLHIVWDLVHVALGEEDVI